MFKLFIVEDEDTTREGLVTLIDWASVGIRISGLAANGMEALRMLEEDPADLLLTDIRMPLMDGLQLIDEIRARSWDMSFVLLSGYGDFEYAQRAMRLGVADFVVKPCSPQEIAAVFAKLTSALAEERKLKGEVQGLARRLHANIPMAKSECLRQWLNSPALVTEDRRDLMQSANMHLAFEHPVVVALRLDNRTLESLHYSSHDTKLLGFAAANIVKETMEQALSQPVEVVRDGEHLVLIASGRYEWLEDKLVQGLTRLQANFRDYLKVTASIGISDSHADIYALHAAYQEALEALELRFFRGSGRHYFYRDAKAARSDGDGHADSKPSVEHLRLEQSAVENLRAGLYAEVLNDTERWLAALQGDDMQSPASIAARTAAYLGRMLQYAQEREPDNAEWFRRLESLGVEINRCETMEELAGFVYRAIRQIIEALNPQKTPKRKVQQALDYIEANYRSSGLSLAGVGQALFVSSTYLSTLFKQELGVNFLDYVHQYRIEKAKALLQSGDMKIQTVAREVGYFDEAHFTKTFKKWTGMLPSQYKKETALRP